MPNTLIVGIDISSQSNSIFFIDDAGNHLIKKPFSLPNDQEGANELIKLVHNLTREKNRALNLIYLKFSTYSQECPFSDIFGKASVAIIENFTPDNIASMPQERFNLSSYPITATIDSQMSIKLLKYLKPLLSVHTDYILCWLSQIA